MNSHSFKSSINDAIYEDPEVVEGYVQRNSHYSKQEENIKRFLQLVYGEHILDLGCGPGQDSYVFAELGKQVFGLDFSSEMIRRAKALKKIQNTPTFLQGDMRQLQHYFREDQFDAIWAHASLLHIQKSELPFVFEGMKFVLKPGGLIAMTLKAGNATKIMQTNKYGKQIEREFVLWQSDEFSKLLKDNGFEIMEHFAQFTGAKPNQTKWLFFFVKVSEI